MGHDAVEKQQIGTVGTGPTSALCARLTGLRAGGSGITVGATAKKPTRNWKVRRKLPDSVAWRRDRVEIAEASSNRETSREAATPSRTERKKAVRGPRRTKHRSGLGLVGLGNAVSEQRDATRCLQELEEQFYCQGEPAASAFAVVETPKYLSGQREGFDPELTSGGPRAAANSRERTGLLRQAPAARSPPRVPVLISLEIFRAGSDQLRREARWCPVVRPPVRTGKAPRRRTQHSGPGVGRID